MSGMFYIWAQPIHITVDIKTRGINRLICKPHSNVNICNICCYLRYNEIVKKFIFYVWVILFSTEKCKYVSIYVNSVIFLPFLSYPFKKKKKNIWFYV